MASLASTMEDLLGFVRLDLAAVEEQLAVVSGGGTMVGEAGVELVGLDGKRLRPLCVLLASRVGGSLNRTVLDVAVAAELVHNATLLHDDVVDNADRRRGREAVRIGLGNAASIFAGDHLLIEALRRINRSGVPGAMEGLLATIAEMIRAESLQLENRGRLDTSEELYFEVARGKSAALFRWSLSAGALAGGAPRETCAALEAFGDSVGTAFQVVDDLLDLVGHHSNTGKNLFSDLLEGKVTYPMICVLRHEPELIDTIRSIADYGAEESGHMNGPTNGDGGGNGGPGHAADESPDERRQRVLAAMAHHGVEATCRRLASKYVEEGVAALGGIPDGEARRALTMVAFASALRER